MPLNDINSPAYKVAQENIIRILTPRVERIVNSKRVYQRARVAGIPVEDIKEDLTQQDYVALLSILDRWKRSGRMDELVREEESDSIAPLIANLQFAIKKYLVQAEVANKVGTPPDGSVARDVLYKLLMYGNEHGIQLKDMAVGNTLEKVSSDLNIPPSLIKNVVLEKYVSTISLDSEVVNRGDDNDSQSLHEYIPSRDPTPEESVLGNSGAGAVKQNTLNKIDNLVALRELLGNDVKPLLSLLPPEERMVLLSKYVLPTRVQQANDNVIPEEVGYDSVLRQMSVWDW